jgi:catechol 2,3-dioxygenase-like lactoylglutathione lyase family enzyme
MTVRAVSHLAIGVRDMDRSLRFYRDLLGLRVDADQPEEIARRSGTTARRRAVYLRWDDGPHASFVVLDQQLDRPGDNDPLRLFDVGVHHVAFWVDDLEAIVERMRDAGTAVAVEPSVGDTRAYGEPPGDKVLTAFLRDPDGNWIQLDQRLPPGAGDSGPQRPG